MGDLVAHAPAPGPAVEVTLLGRRLPPGVEREVHVIAEGRALDCRDGRWRTVLAVVEHGCVELVTPGGARLRLTDGAVFTLARLGPVDIRNAGAGSAVIATAGPARRQECEMTDAEHFVERLLALQVPGAPTKAGSAFRYDGDGRFIAVRMRDVFALAKEFVDLDPDQVELLLDSPIHEVRVGAVSIMDFQARRRTTPAGRRKALYELYLRRHDRIDNWDLVDRAAPWVVGGYLYDRPRDPLYRLARSTNVWERRTAIVATWYFIRQGQLDDTYAIAELLVDDDHDLIQKAVGGWLREAGKRDMARLRAFLDAHAATMPRTTLRYATEHLAPEERAHYRQVARSGV